jgi:adenylate cyclase
MVLSYKIFIEGKDKRFLKQAFGNYISPELIEIMHESGEAPKLGGEAGVKTAFFTDIQSFSTFSEQLSASVLVELLNEYLTEMTDILLANKGTLDKYEGDAIIAFYGAPMKLENHAELACKTTIQMQEKLLELRKYWVSQGDKWPLIVHNMRMRIGLNSGDIVTGNMGSKNRMNYTMIGDAVNLAARLEESAKQYGIFNHVSQMTQSLCADKFVFRELDTIKVVGKSQPVTTYDLMGETGNTEDYLLELKDKFEKGLEYYKNQDWKSALSFFQQSLELEIKRYDDTKTNPSEIYIDRVKNFMLYPPPRDWDGVYTLTKK